MTRRRLLGTALAVIAGLALLAGCQQRRGFAVKSESASPGVAAAQEEFVVRTAALLPVLNRTEEPEAPVMLARALAASFKRAPFKLIQPEEVPGRIAPLYELGVVPRFIAEVDEGGRTAPEVARLIGQGLQADAMLVASVTFYQQYVDRLPDGAPGEAATTVVGAEVHLIDARTGTALWSASKVRRDRSAIGFPSFEGTVKALADDLVGALPTGATIR